MHSAGPESGVFTDGGASPNPGPGGWGAVYVKEGEILVERFGASSGKTTNNRMELTALIEGAKLVPSGEKVTLYSDSQICVKTVNEWAPMWKARGWKRKAGPVENLELVQELYAICVENPNLKLEWVPGHAGWRWNEYAHVLANGWSYRG